VPNRPRGGSTTSVRALKTSQSPLDQQKKLVRKFFDQFVDPNTGAISRGVNDYKKPEDFRRDLTTHLRQLIVKLMPARTDAASSSVDVEIERHGKVKMNLPFYIARYPVTYIQFQAFIDAPDGYHNGEIDWFGRLVREKRQES
jgi:formylglycine-generating enzyme required for sulfatase activity